MRNFRPRSALQDKNVVTGKQAPERPFYNGAFPDIPASLVPVTGVAESYGYTMHGDRAEPTGGCKLWSAIPLPTLSTGYSWSKTGDVVTKTVGEDFADTNLLQFLIHDDGAHEQVVEVLNASSVRVDTETAREPSVSGAVRGQIHNTFKHDSLRKGVLHIDSRLFVFDYEVSAYTEVYGISTLTIKDQASRMAISKNLLYIACAHDIFTLDIEDEPYLYWHCNTVVPTDKLAETEESNINPYGSRYLYSLLQMSGSIDTRKRTDIGVFQKSETGCSKIDSNQKDYSQIFNSRPVGDESTIYQTLVGGTLDAPYTTVSAWAAINDGQFRISFKEQEYNVFVDFSALVSMVEVAEQIEIALQYISPTLKVTFEADHFEILSPSENGIITYTTAGDGGVNISPLMKTENGTGFLFNNTYTLARKVVGLTIPINSVTGQREFHHTHYRVSKTMDVGVNGVDPITGLGNNTDRFIWTDDVIVAKAFNVTIAGNTLVAQKGNFLPMDVYSKIRLENGAEYVISEYVDENTAWVEAGSEGIYDQVTSAAIGGDSERAGPIRVLTCSQTDYIVTRESGVFFQKDFDERKTLFYAGGLIVHIVEVIDENRARVDRSAAINSRAACMDPTCRAYSDRIPDSALKNRINGYSTRNRFWEPLPECDEISAIAGFLITGQRGTININYSQITAGLEYLVGFHNPAKQTDILKDNLTAFSDFQNQLIAYCSHSTAGCAVNAFESERNTLTGVTTNILKAFNVVDYEKGLSYYGDFVKIGYGLDVVITSEPAVRTFNGVSYSENLVQDRVQSRIEKSTSQHAMMYDPFNGVTMWGLE